MQARKDNVRNVNTREPEWLGFGNSLLCSCKFSVGLKKSPWIPAVNTVMPWGITRFLKCFTLLCPSHAPPTLSTPCRVVTVMTCVSKKGCVFRPRWHLTTWLWCSRMKSGGIWCPVSGISTRRWCWRTTRAWSPWVRQASCEELTSGVHKLGAPETDTRLLNQLRDKHQRMWLMSTPTRA